MANTNNTISKDGLPPDISGKATDKNNARLNGPCVMALEGDFVLVNPIRDPETKEIARYSVIRTITEKDLDNKELVPATWNPKGKISFRQAQNEMFQQIKAWLQTRKDLEAMFKQIKEENRVKLTKNTTLGEMLSASNVPLEEKLVNSLLFSINVQDPHGSGRLVSLRDVYFDNSNVNKESNAIIDAYVDSFEKVQDVETISNFKESPDHFLHSNKDCKVSYYNPPIISKNPADKAKKNTVYLGNLFRDPLHNGSCKEYISEAKAGKFVMPEHREDELIQGTTILASSKKGNIALTGAAGVGKTALAGAICVQGQKRLEKSKTPVLAYEVDLQRLINAGSGIYGEWQKKALELIEATKTSSKGIYQWAINIIKKYDIDIEKLDKIIYQRTPIGTTIPASVPFFQNLMNVGQKLYAAGKIPKHKICWLTDEAHSLFEIGKNGDSTSGFVDMIKPMLENGDFNYIIMTTEDEYSKYFKDSALKSRFAKLLVKELDKKSTFDILKTKAEDLQHKCKKEGTPVKISDENLWKILEVAEGYLFNIKRPRGPLDLLDNIVSNTVTNHYFQTKEMSELEIKSTKLKQKLEFFDKDDVEYKLLKDQIKLYDQQYEALNKDLQSKIKSNLAKGGVTFDNQDIMSSVSRIINVNPLVFAKNKQERLNIVSDELHKNIIGHKNVIKKVVDDYTSKLSTLNEYHESPYITLLVGVPGTGKTELGRVLGKIEGGGTKVLAMNDYAQKGSDTNLFGSPKGYVGYGEPSELLSFAKANPFGTIILDEVEKAHPEIMNKFLQIFEKGTYNDPQTNEVVSFRGINFVLTSNALENDLAQNPNLSLKELKNRLKNWKPAGAIDSGFAFSDSTHVSPFTAPLLSRIGDNIYGFGNLSQGEMFKLVELKLSQLNDSIKNSSLKMEIDYGQPNKEYTLAKNKYAQSIKSLPKNKQYELMNAWEIDHSTEKYNEDSIVYYILDKVMQQEGDGRSVEKIINEQIKKPLEWLTIQADSTSNLYKAKVKLSIDENNELVIKSPFNENKVKKQKVLVK